MKEFKTFNLIKEGLLFGEQLTKEAIYQITKISCDPINYAHQLHSESDNLKANLIIGTSLALPLTIMTTCLITYPEISPTTLSLVGVGSYIGHATGFYFSKRT
jgi:hypothetical protein